MIHAATRIRILALLLLGLAPSAVALTWPPRNPTPVVVFGGNSDLPPNEFLDEHGKPQGFNVEVAQVISRMMGLQVRVDLSSWGETRRALDDGRLSATLGMSYSAARAEKYDFSTPYLQLYYTVFVRKKSNPLQNERDLDGREVIVHKGAISEEYIRANFPQARLIVVEHPVDGMRLLASGRHDCFVIGRLQGYYLRQKYGFTSLTALGKPLLETQYCFAVRKGDSALLAKLNEGLKIIKATGQYSELYEKWLGVLEPQPVERGRLLSYGVWAFSLLLALLCGAALWTWSLRKKVAKRTHQLAEELFERRHAEEALRESESRYRTLVDNIDLGITRIGADFRIKMGNRMMLRRYAPNGEALEGRLCYEVFADCAAPCSECPGGRAMATGAPSEGVVERFDLCGRPVMFKLQAFPTMDAAGSPTGFIEVVEDITERRRIEVERNTLEAQMQHAQKLESLGVLAGGIAHDFNNLLMGVLGNADLALGELHKPAEAARRLEDLKRAALRAADLTRQMLAYSGRGKFLIEPLDVNALIEEMVRLLQVSISKRVTLHCELAPGLPPVKGDAAQVRQVIMNLITNASDAIGDKSGVITLSTGVRRLDQAYFARTYLQDGLPEGHYVFIDVADTGVGMDQSTIARIFDPFFTTKFTGRGLGLAAVLGIIRGHHGAIEIQSEPGKGAMFRVFFPCSDESSGASGPAPGDASPGAEWVGRGSILIVDDEDMVREVAQMMIESFGFTVLTASDGAEGVKIVQAGEPLDAVLLDLTMPRLSGEETFREIHQLRPHLPVILVSGYNEQEVTDQFMGRGIAGFIQKPFQLAELRDKLRAVLGQ